MPRAVGHDRLVGSAVGRWCAGELLLERVGKANGMLQVAGFVHLDVEAKLIEEARAEHLLLLLAR